MPTDTLVMKLEELLMIMIMIIPPKNGKYRLTFFTKVLYVQYRYFMYCRDTIQYYCSLTVLMIQNIIMPWPIQQ